LYGSGDWREGQVVGSLTWREAARLGPGVRVRFSEPFEVCPERVFPAGTTGTVAVNNLDELSADLYVLPDDPRQRIVLGQWDGCIYLAPPTDGWDQPAPVGLA
jgi:hypothetical protein